MPSENELVFRYIGDFSDFFQKSEKLGKELENNVNKPVQHSNEAFAKWAAQGGTKFKSIGKALGIFSDQLGLGKNNVIDFAATSTMQFESIVRSSQGLGMSLTAGLVPAVALVGYSLGNYLAEKAGAAEKKITGTRLAMYRLGVTARETSEILKDHQKPYDELKDALEAEQVSIELAQAGMLDFKDTSAATQKVVSSAKDGLVQYGIEQKNLKQTLSDSEDALQKAFNEYARQRKGLQSIEEAARFAREEIKKFNDSVKRGETEYAAKPAIGMGRKPPPMPEPPIAAQAFLKQYEALTSGIKDLGIKIQSVEEDQRSFTDTLARGQETLKKNEEITKTLTDANTSYQTRIKETEKAIAELSAKQRDLQAVQSESWSPELAAGIAQNAVALIALKDNLQKAKEEQQQFNDAKEKDILQAVSIIAGNAAITDGLRQNTDILKQNTDEILRNAEAERRRQAEHLKRTNIIALQGEQLMAAEEQFASWAASLQANMADVYQGIMTISNAISSGLGQAFAQAIVYGENFAEAIKTMAKTVAATIIAMIVEIALQQIIYWILESLNLLVFAEQKVGTEIAYGATAAAASAYASVPFPGNMLAGPAAGAAAMGVLTALSIAGAKMGKASTAALPKFASGAIVTRPTIAMIAEAGQPELVAPRSDYEKLMAGMGGDIHIYLEVDGERTAEAVVPHIPSVVRRRGIKGL